MTVITRPKTQSLAGSDREVMTLMSAVSTVLPNLGRGFGHFGTKLRSPRKIFGLVVIKNVNTFCVQEEQLHVSKEFLILLVLSLKEKPEGFSSLKKFVSFWPYLGKSAEN